MDKRKIGSEKIHPFLHSRILGAAYQDEGRLRELRHTLLREDYVHLPNLLEHHVLKILRDELATLEGQALTRDMVMPGPETPRKMRVLGGQQLVQESPILGCLYRHWEVYALLRSLVDAPLFPCPHPLEFMVANFLVQQGHTHGWHLDDPRFALIIFLDAPSAEHGGQLEYIRDWRKLSHLPRVTPEDKVNLDLIELCRARGEVQVRSHAAGDAYLLIASDCLHRVTALTDQSARRLVLNLAYEAMPDPLSGSTATILYNPEYRD